MPGTGTVDPPPAPRGAQAATFGVFRYVPGATPPLEPMPWVVFLGDQRRAGHQPASARYRYDFRDDAPPAWPRRIEDVYPYRAPGKYPVKVDDRIVTLRLHEDGSYDIIRDGFAHLPQANLSPGTEAVTITVPDVPFREFDEPFKGAVWRDESLEFWGKPPGNLAPLDFETAEPVRFNPNGQPNATPADDGTDGAESADSGDAGNPDDPLDPENPRRQYPVFVSPKIDRTPPPRLWTLGMAVRYLVLVGNPRSGTPKKERWVHNDDIAGIDSRLRAMRPTDPAGVIDPDDSATYEFEDIIVPDFDATGMAWPEAVARLIEPHGFLFRWMLDDELDEDGHPYHAWSIIRKDTTAKKVRLKIQEAGETVDFNKSNTSVLNLGREFPAANTIRVITTPRLWQADFILAPKFQPHAGDPTMTTEDKEAKFKKGGSEFELHREDYRVWIAAEDGARWWNINAGDWGTTYLDLTPLLDKDGDILARKWSRRRRPPRRDLLTTDEKGKPLDAELWISIDWGIDLMADPDNVAPRVWDREHPGTWQRITRGQWSLLDDRIGIALNVEKPWEWAIGTPEAGAADQPFPGGKVNVLQSTAAPQPATGAGSGPNRKFWLRLTCVIEGDHDLDIEAPQRAASPTEFLIARYREARDRYRRGTVSRRGHLGDSADDDARDDTPAAEAYAYAIRRQEELGHFSGSATIPWFSQVYDVGNAVERIEGREIDLDGASASEQKEGKVYPTIVGIDRTAEAGSEGTTLHLADVRNEGVVVPWEATPRVVQPNLFNGPPNLGGSPAAGAAVLSNFGVLTK